MGRTCLLCESCKGEVLCPFCGCNSPFLLHIYFDMKALKRRSIVGNFYFFREVCFIFWIWFEAFCTVVYEKKIFFFLFEKLSPYDLAKAMSKVDFHLYFSAKCEGKIWNMKLRLHIKIPLRKHKGNISCFYIKI